MRNRMWIWDRSGWPEWDYALAAHTIETLKEIRDRREQLDEEWAESPTLVAKAVGGALLQEGSSTSAIEGGIHFVRRPAGRGDQRGPGRG